MEINGITLIQNDLKSRDEIDRYMKGYNDTLMLLDYLEGEAVLNKANQDLNNAWFKKVDSNSWS